MRRLRIGVKIAKNEEIIFEDFHEAMEYIDTFIPELAAGTLNSDDIITEYYVD
jgi:hypothetical protein